MNKVSHADRGQPCLLDVHGRDMRDTPTPRLPPSLPPIFPGYWLRGGSLTDGYALEGEGILSKKLVDAVEEEQKDGALETVKVPLAEAIAHAHPLLLDEALKALRRSKVRIEQQLCDGGHQRIGLAGLVALQKDAARATSRQSHCHLGRDGKDLRAGHVS